MSDRPTRQTSLAKELFMGFCLGTANIIPGVSGGTFLLIFKIYERIFSILGNINGINIHCFFSKLCQIFFSPGKRSVKAMGHFMSENDFVFLFKLIGGAAAAILGLSGLMKYLIIHHFSITYALFFGLIFLSIMIPVKMLTQKTVRLLLFVFIGAFFTVYLTAAVDPYEKVKVKSDMYKQLYRIQNSENNHGPAFAKAEEISSPRILSFSNKYSPYEYVYSCICGAVSISAMVLPGLSGSLVLILMGEYFEVVSAISALKTINLDAVCYLGSFTLGVVFGGLFFARLVNLVLKRFYNATMAVLTGLMIGSLYALWPFKKSVIMAEQYIKTGNGIQVVENVRIYTNANILPQNVSQIIVAAIAFLCGCGIMLFFLRQENNKK